MLVRYSAVVSSRLLPRLIPCVLILLEVRSLRAQPQPDIRLYRPSAESFRNPDLRVFRWETPREFPKGRASHG